MEQEHILNTHIDTLKEWWENADAEGIVHAGDTIIKKGRAGYVIYTAWPHEDGEDVTMWKYEQDPPGADYRILARAPKPKPAWHDAVAVIATGDAGDGDWITGVWVPDGTPEYWESADAGIILGREELSDVTPLIEAKVTAEMVKRGLGEAEERGYIERVFGEVDGIDQNAFRAILTAALGLDPA